MGKVFSDESICLFAESFASCISNFSQARQTFMRSLPPEQQELFRNHFNKMKRPELPFQEPLGPEEPYQFNKK